MATQSWQFDNAHSGLNFSVRHMVIAKVRGRFTRWSGQLVLDDQDITASRVEVTIDAASIDTNEEKRDGHLRSADFFDVAAHPQLTFRSTRVQRAQGDNLQVTGELTIRSVTRPVTLEVESLGQGKDPWGNQRIAFAARASIDRKEFGLQWNQALEAGGVLVGERVDLELEVQAIPAAVAKAA